MSVGVDNMIVGTVLSTLYLSNQFDLTESKGCSIGKLLDDEEVENSMLFANEYFDHKKLDFSNSMAMRKLRCISGIQNWSTNNGPGLSDTAGQFKNTRFYETSLGGLIFLNCHAGIQFNDTMFDSEVQLIEISECNHNVFHPVTAKSSTLQFYSGGRSSLIRGQITYVNSYATAISSYHKKINDFFVDANSVAYVEYDGNTYYSQMYGNFQDYVDTWCHNITVPFRGKTAQYRQGNKTTTYSSQYDDCVQPEDPLAPFIPTSVIPTIETRGDKTNVGFIVGITLASLLATTILVIGAFYFIIKVVKSE